MNRDKVRLCVQVPTPECAHNPLRMKLCAEPERQRPLDAAERTFVSFSFRRMVRSRDGLHPLSLAPAPAPARSAGWPLLTVGFCEGLLAPTQVPVVCVEH